MPDGTGFTILEKLNQLNKQEGIIIISAKNSLNDKLKGLLLGADDYRLCYKGRQWLNKKRKK